MEEDAVPKKGLSLSVKILIGMCCGIAVGILFGDYCGFLQIFGDAFIKLLQITILPYITVSMILGIGGFTREQAGLMARKAGLFMLLFWGLSFLLVLLWPLTFPEWETAAFFSTSIIQAPQKVDLLNPTFIIAGLLSFFGGVDIALPFMLDLMRLPSDLYQLYVTTGVINGRFATLLAAMNMVVFTLLSTAALTGVMAVNKRKLLLYVLTSILITLGVIGATRVYFGIAVHNTYKKNQVIANMQSQVVPVPRKVIEPGEAIPAPVDAGLPVLQRIRKNDVLRVGYNPENMPFSYFSEIGELVGFDVDMAQLLAKEMKVKLQFIPFTRDTMVAQLNADQFDVIMSGVPITTPRLEEITFSAPYIETTVCFIVRDHRRNQFATDESIHKIKQLKIALPIESNYFLVKLKNFLPQAEVIEVNSVRDFFEADEGRFDAMLSSAEGGSAWTLIYPDFQAVIPMPDVSRIPLAYPVAGRDEEFADFLSQWIQLKKAGLEYDWLYDHWILGKSAERKQPRWSVIRNVLKLVD